MSQTNRRDVPLFCVSNHHSASSGPPPHIDDFALVNTSAILRPGMENRLFSSTTATPVKPSFIGATLVGRPVIS